MNRENNVKSEDLHLINDLNAALRKEKYSGQFWVIILLFIFLVVSVIWAYNSPAEKVTCGNGNIILNSREQVVQSLDPGIVTEIMAKEGDMVEKDQILTKPDDTRSSAVSRESEVKVESLEATVARLKAEAYGVKLSFPDSVGPELRRREIAAHETHRQVMTDAVSGLSQSKAALDREIAITAPMVAGGMVSEVELLRMRRESIDLATQISEYHNRYETDANNELL